MQLQELEVGDRELLTGDARSRPKFPVLWRGVGSEWPCTKSWSFAGLAQRFAGRTIRVRVTDDEVAAFFNYKADDSPYDRLAKFDDYIESIVRMSGGNRARPAYASISILQDPVSSDWARTLLDECPVSAWFTGEKLNEYRLWIGAAGQRSTIHGDPYDNLNAQIIGKKRFIVFAPDQHENLYPEFIHPHLWASRIDPDRPDLGRFPKFAGARGLVGELLPGDVLFIPKYWWHCLWTSEASLNINRWTYSEEEFNECWHEQDAAKKFIDYGELVGVLENKFALLDRAGKERYRDSFEQLRQGMLRLAEEGSGAVDVVER